MWCTGCDAEAAAECYESHPLCPARRLERAAEAELAAVRADRAAALRRLAEDVRREELQLEREVAADAQRHGLEALRTALDAAKKHPLYHLDVGDGLLMRALSAFNEDLATQLYRDPLHLATAAAAQDPLLFSAITVKHEPGLELEETVLRSPEAAPERQGVEARAAALQEEAESLRAELAAVLERSSAAEAAAAASAAALQGREAALREAEAALARRKAALKETEPSRAAPLVDVVKGASSAVLRDGAALEREVPAVSETGAAAAALSSGPDEAIVRVAKENAVVKEESGAPHAARLQPAEGVESPGKRGPAGHGGAPERRGPADATAGKGIPEPPALSKSRPDEKRHRQKPRREGGEPKEHRKERSGKDRADAARTHSKRTASRHEPSTTREADRKKTDADDAVEVEFSVKCGASGRKSRRSRKRRRGSRDRSPRVVCDSGSPTRTATGAEACPPRARTVSAAEGAARDGSTAASRLAAVTSGPQVGGGAARADGNEAVQGDEQRQDQDLGAQQDSRPGGAGDPGVAAGDSQADVLLLTWDSSDSTFGSGDSDGGGDESAAAVRDAAVHRDARIITVKAEPVDSAVEGAQKTEPRGIDALPDEILVKVLAAVPADRSGANILALRLVSPRWRGLVLHPHVWRRRRLTVSSPAEAAVLRLAPVLDALTIYVNRLDKERAALQALAEGGCQILGSLRLELLVTVAVSKLIRRILSRQSSLQELNFEVRCWSAQSNPAPVLSAVDSLRCLRRLTLDGGSELSYSFHMLQALEELTAGRGLSPALVGSLLDASRRTLLVADCRHHDVLRELGGCSQLREATVRAADDLHHLARLGRLETLNVHVTRRGHLKLLKEFLDQSQTVPRRLRLHVDAASSDPEYTLLHAVDSMRRVVYLDLAGRAYLTPKDFLTCLGALPNLEVLRLTGLRLYTRLVAGWTTGTAPKLRRLHAHGCPVAEWGPQLQAMCPGLEICTALHCESDY